MASSIRPFLHPTSEPLSFLERGGEGLPIVFLHGNGFCKEIFSRQFDSARLAEFRLIAFDLPGHGASPEAADPDSDYTFRGMTTPVLAGIRSLGIERCIVAGWSLGGHVAIEMLEDPLVAGIFAFGAPPAPNGPMGLIRAFHLNRMLLLAGKSRFSESDVAHFGQNALGAEADEKFVEAMQQVDPEFRPALSRSLLLGSGTSQRERMLKATKPVALVNGEHDPLVRRAYMEALAAPCLYKGGALTLPDCAHAPFLQSQASFESLLKSFADDVSDGTAMVPLPLQKQAVNA